MIKVTAKRGGATFAVKIVPRTSRNEIAGVQQDALRVRLTAPPVKGAANKALIGFLADVLDVPRRDLEIVAGQSSRQKTIFVTGLSSHEVVACLEGHLSDAG